MTQRGLRPVDPTPVSLQIEVARALRREIRRTSVTALEVRGGEAVIRLFRERLLARLVERHATSEDLARKLLAWKPPGLRP
jgi:hypothetical protein